MSVLSSAIEHGYLVLADISGYTSFLTHTELDHAQEILSDLLETILARLGSLLVIDKLEGDAIFAYTPASKMMRGETLLELIEATYADFRERTKNVRRHTTCTCRACQNIPLLDLKFIAHYGEFALQSIGPNHELVGSDVNLTHRLLKNHVAEQTGWHGYALFTRQGLDRMGLQLENAAVLTESYEHLGGVTVCAVDLHARYDEWLAERRVMVNPEDAIVSFEEDYDVPSPVLWNWMNEPALRARYAPGPRGRKFVAVKRPGGRTGRGATTHCVHGQQVAMRETVLDWKPFDYFTVEQDSGPLGVVQATYRFDRLEENRTRLSMQLKGHMPKLPAFLSPLVFKFVHRRIINYQLAARRMRAAIEADIAAPITEPPVPGHLVQ